MLSSKLLKTLQIRSTRRRRSRQRRCPSRIHLIYLLNRIRPSFKQEQNRLRPVQLNLRQKRFESYASTDTTVKVKEEPKSSTDTTVKKHKAAPATDTTVKKESSNKISLTPRGTSSTPATSSATPIPPAGPPPEKVPKPPPYPPGNLNVQLVNHFQHHHQHQFTENNHHDPKSNVFQHRLLLRSVTILEVPTLRKNMNLCRDDGVKLLQMMSKCVQHFHTILIKIPIWRPTSIF